MAGEGAAALSLALTFGCRHVYHSYKRGGSFPSLLHVLLLHFLLIQFLLLGSVGRSNVKVERCANTEALLSNSLALEQGKVKDKLSKKWMYTIYMDQWQCEAIITEVDRISEVAFQCQL